MPDEPQEPEETMLLDQALDDLAAGRAARADGDAGELADTAAKLRAAIPDPPEGAAERGRAAVLAAAGRPRRRRPPLLLAATLVACLLLLAVPALAAAQRALPGSPLWPLREAGQNARYALASSATDGARMRLDTAQDMLTIARDEPPDRRVSLAREARDLVAAGLERLQGATGADAAAQRDRAEGLIAEADALLGQADDAQPQPTQPTIPPPATPSPSPSPTPDDHDDRGRNRGPGGDDTDDDGDDDDDDRGRGGDDDGGDDSSGSDDDSSGGNSGPGGSGSDD